MSDDDALVLRGVLAVAVSLEIDRLCAAPERFRLAEAEEAGRYIAEHGDDLQYRSAERGDTAKAFTQLARGLAALAFAPGGVTFGGMHWCTDHAACLAAQDRKGRRPGG